MTRPRYISASSSRTEQRLSPHREIHAILASALALFLIATFVLAEMLPSPSGHVDATMGADPIAHARRAAATDGVETEDGGAKRTLRSERARRPRRHYERLIRGRRDARPRPESEPVVAGQERGGKGIRKNRGKARDRKPKSAAQSANNDAAAHESDEGDGETEEGEPRLVHILETRFMQNQPNLVQLARARLRLFATICLPTVLHQGAWGQFLWVIRTDPKLNDEIKRELIDVLDEAGALVDKDEDERERALTYVIGSNDNYIVSNSTTLSPSLRPFDTLVMLSDALSNPQSIFAGKASSMQMLYDEISSKRVVKDVFLWTRLDADDGLNVAYMEYLQSQAIRYFFPDRYEREIMAEIPEEALEKTSANKTLAMADAVKGRRKLVKNAYTPPQWTYWCAALNIDWFLTDPVRDPDHKNGTVYPVIHANVCVTPGVTVALQGSFDPLRVPRLDHDKIISSLRKRGGGKMCGRTGLSVFDPDEIGEDEREDVDDGSCFHMVTLGIASVRSRTPTSAGMLGVNPDATQLQIINKKPKITSSMWRSMGKHYHISNEGLLSTNAYFAEHVYDIAEENARGQCTRGHSCKSSSKDLLQQYVDLRSEIGGGFDVVDVLTR